MVTDTPLLQKGHVHVKDVDSQPDGTSSKEQLHVPLLCGHRKGLGIVVLQTQDSLCVVKVGS